MKRTATLHRDDATDHALHAYASRQNIRVSTAISYALKSGLLRLDTCRRYRQSPKGRRAAQRAKRRR